MSTVISEDREVMGSIPVGDSEFFFVPRSYQVDQFTFYNMATYSRILIGSY